MISPVTTTLSNAREIRRAKMMKDPAPQPNVEQPLPPPSSSSPSFVSGMMHHRRAVSAPAAKANTSHAAPARAMTSSPALFLKRKPSRQASLAVTQGEAIAAAAAAAQLTAEEELLDWGCDNGNPPLRLSRSLSSSQASSTFSSWAGSGGGAAGCAKVTRSSLRRRSRASSTSSPLPMLETSASLPNGSGGTVADTAGAAATVGSWGTRSVGSDVFVRPSAARRRSFAQSFEGLHSRSSTDVATSAVEGSAPLVRSHRMRSSGWSQGSGAGGNIMAVDRPVPLLRGSSVGDMRGLLDEDPSGETASSYVGGDPGVGWVLCAPCSAPLGRHRSQSVANSSQSVLKMARSRSESTPDSRPIGSISGQLSRLASNGETMRERSSNPSQMARPRLDAETEREHKSMLDAGSEMRTSPAQTPQVSPSREGTSAAQRRAHGLSSVARRMDRLDIGSSDVKTNAAQVHKP